MTNKKENPKNIKKIILNPDTKTIVSQININKSVCPRSGWFTKKKIIANKIKNEKKYLLLIPILFSAAIILAMKITNNGLTNSMGWNLGKEGKSSHLFDPLTSVPIKGIKNRNIMERKNK